MVLRRYALTIAESVRRYETVIVETDHDLVAEMPTGDEEPTEGFLAIIGEGDVVSSDYGPCDEPQYVLALTDVEDVEPPVTTLPVPYPPTTAAQAEAWVRWAETEIGLGWHPDTSGSDLTTFAPVGIEVRCACGETFNPNDVDDTVHAERQDGEECGLRGVIVGRWGSNAPLFPDPAVCRRYNDGLAAAHALLPDIYLTSMTILKELHPDLLTTVKGE